MKDKSESSWSEIPKNNKYFYWDHNISYDKTSASEINGYIIE